MEMIRLLTILYLALMVLSSGYLCTIIYVHISNKALLQKTVIDLIYQGPLL